MSGATKWPSDKFHRKSVRSALVGGIFFAVLIFSFAAIRAGPTDNGAFAFIRKIHLLNENLFSKLQSPTRLSVDKPPPLGREPRVNGDIGLETGLDLAAYALQVKTGEKEVFLKVESLKALPPTQVSTDFKCVEGWSEVVQYSGLKFSDFLEKYDLGKKPDGSYYDYVGLETPDGEYYVSIDMKSMLHPQTVLAFEMNGAPISEDNGAPVRLIIPIKYGIKSLKRVGKVFFSDERPRDYWTERGYDWYAGL